MIRLIEAPTLDDALSFLRADIAREEAQRLGRTKNLIFCEDGLTLLAERAVIAATGGTFRSEVSTFARFLAGERRVLSKHGSVMAVSAILTDLEGELGCFSARAAEAVYETIAQLSASRVDAQMLRAGAEGAEGMLRVKLLDLARILERYEQFLREGGLLDESGYLALLPEKIASGALADTNVYFFAFPSFTRQAAEGVRAACACAGNVTGVFLGGKEAFYTGEGARVFREAAAEFGGAETARLACSLEGDAKRLHGALFSPEAYVQGVPRAAEHVCAFAAADEAEEAGAVAVLLKKHGQPHGDDRRARGVPYPVHGGRQAAVCAPSLLQARRRCPERRVGRVSARLGGRGALQRLLCGERRLPQLSHEIRRVAGRRAAGDPRGRAGI